jgi:hypothetical protein
VKKNTVKKNTVKKKAYDNSNIRLTRLDLDALAALDDLQVILGERVMKDRENASATINWAVKVAHKSVTEDR